MGIFKLNKSALSPLTEKEIDVERDIQKLTEQNLEIIFGLKFVAGASNQEFSVRVNEQDFYIDTVAFDEETRSITLIEYKKDRSFSVIDQGFAYLAAMLNNKADFVLEINERLGKKFTKNDIDWELSRIIFISNEFTNYQKNAINFKDLPMYLYEVKMYNDLVDYNPIKPFKTSESINKFVKDKKVGQVTKQVKVYSADDLFQQTWTSSKELYEKMRHEIMSLRNDITENFTKLYIAFKAPRDGQRYNFVEIQPMQSGLRIHLDAKINKLNDPKKILIDWSNRGHWATGHTVFVIKSESEIPYAMRLIKESLDNLITVAK